MSDAWKCDLPTSLIGPDWDVDILCWGGSGGHLIYLVIGATANKTITTAINIDAAIVIVAQDWPLELPNLEDSCPPLPEPPSGWSAWGGCIANTDSLVLLGAECMHVEDIRVDVQFKHWTRICIQLNF